MVKSTEDSGKFKSFDIYECLTERSSNSYCVDCFADIEAECICDRVVGYDAVSGYSLVDITDEEGHICMVNSEGPDIGAYYNSDNTLETLIKYFRMGFKLVPLGNDSIPAGSSLITGQKKNLHKIIGDFQI